MSRCGRSRSTRSKPEKRRTAGPAESRRGQSFALNGCGRRAAPWRASIQPGYSGGKGADLVELAPCRRRRAEARPPRGSVELLDALGADDDAHHERLGQDPGQRHVGHADAVLGRRPRAWRRRRPRRGPCPPAGSRSWRARPSPLPGAPGPYLPESRPPASGDQTIRPSFSSASIGTISRSRSRPAME